MSWSILSSRFTHVVACVRFCFMLSCFSRVRLFAAPRTVALQAPLSIGFSRQEYCSGIVFFCLGFVDLLENQFSSNLQNFSHFFPNIFHHTSFSISYFYPSLWLHWCFFFFFPASFLCFILESFWCYVFKNTDLVSAVSDPLWTHPVQGFPLEETWVFFYTIHFLLILCIVSLCHWTHGPYL